MQNAENIAAEAGENRISVVSILVFNRESAERVNSCFPLTENISSAEWVYRISGRMFPCFPSRSTLP